jgi:hypothetical protein
VDESLREEASQTRDGTIEMVLSAGFWGLLIALPGILLHLRNRRRAKTRR